MTSKGVKITKAESTKISFLQKYLFKPTFISVLPNRTAYLYINNEFEQTLQPGLYQVDSSNQKLDIYSLPNTPSILISKMVENFTKDNLTIRLSTACNFSIIDGPKFLESCNFEKDTEEINKIFDNNIMFSAFFNYVKEQFEAELQIHTRQFLSSIESEELHVNIDALQNYKSESLQLIAEKYGLKIHSFQIRTIHFPRYLQSIYAKKLQSKTDALIDVETARTTVAVARTLKNAADLLNQNENIRFLKTLDTIEKIATKGRHSFTFSDLLLPKKTE